MFGPLYAEKWWLEEYMKIPLRCKSSRTGAKSTICDDILNVFQTLRNLMIIQAPSGTGKSVLLARIAQAWQNEDPRLHDFDYVLVIPLREIRNYTSSLADIICKDLNILDASAVPELRRCLKSNSKKVLILLDAYDILEEKEKVRYNIYNGLIEGRETSEAPYATIVVNTRPDSLHHILKYAQKRKDEYKIIELLAVPEEEAMRTWNRALVGEKVSDYVKQKYEQHIKESIPRHLLRVPILLKMMCFIWKCEVKKHRPKPVIFKSVTSIFDQLFGIAVCMAEERCRLEDKYEQVVYKSLGDDRLPRIIKRNVDKVCKMSYDCVERKIYTFDPPKFNSVRLNAIDCSVVCFIRVDGNYNKLFGEFIDPIFQHYCAAYHLVNDAEKNKNMIEKVKNSSEDMQTCLEDLSQTIPFAVGMRESVLREISNCNLKSQLTTYEEYGNVDLNLSYMAQLFNECEGGYICNIFAKNVSRCRHVSRPLCLPSCRTSTCSQRYLVEGLGETGITRLLLNAHDSNISVSSDRKISLTGVDRKRCITDPLLLSQLSRTELKDTDILHIRQAELLPFAPQEKFTVKTLYYLLNYNK